MNIKTKFDIGSSVVLKHDRDRILRTITGVSVRQNKTVSYNLISGTVDSWHYDFEIETEGQKAKTGFIK